MSEQPTPEQERLPSLPLEYPPAEIARIYASRLSFLLLNLLLIVLVMALVYLVVSYVQREGWIGIAFGVIGGVIGYLLRKRRERSGPNRPSLRDRLRTRIEAAASGLPASSGGVPRHRLG